MHSHTPLHAALSGPITYCQTYEMRHEATAKFGRAAAVSASRARPRLPSSQSGLAQHQSRPCGRREAAKRRSGRRSSAPLVQLNVKHRAQPPAGTRLHGHLPRAGMGGLVQEHPGLCGKGGRAHSHSLMSVLTRARRCVSATRRDASHLSWSRSQARRGPRDPETSRAPRSGIEPGSRRSGMALWPALGGITSGLWHVLAASATR